MALSGLIDEEVSGHRLDLISKVFSNSVHSVVLPLHDVPTKDVQNNWYFLQSPLKVFNLLLL